MPQFLQDSMILVSGFVTVAAYFQIKCFLGQTCTIRSQWEVNRLTSQKASPKVWSHLALVISGQTWILSI